MRKLILEIVQERQIKGFQMCLYWRQSTTVSFIAGFLKLILAREHSAPAPRAPCSCETGIWQRQASSPFTSAPFCAIELAIEVVLIVFHSGPVLQQQLKLCCLGNGRRIEKGSRKKIEDFDWWLFHFVTIKSKFLHILWGKIPVHTSNTLTWFS